MTQTNGERVLVAGAGVAGLTLALTCHQLGIPVTVLESVRELKPLGVGINLQPNAVRELFDLGLADDLATIGIEAREWALVGRNGNDIWSEPRGRLAGYSWPQFAVHRGQLQMLLYQTVVQRLGPDAVQTGSRVTGWSNTAGGVVATVQRRGLGDDDPSATDVVAGRVLIAADGLHSAVRQQMFPQQGPPHWGGAILWRGTAFAPPIRSGSSFLLVGSLEQRFVHYPIGPVDPETGLQLQNWIAELTVDPGDGLPDSSWNKQVDLDAFLPAFANWNFDWLNIPALIRSAPTVWEFPMVDRDPVDHWVDGNVLLIGDAAHVMYPVGSNGASQAVVDARILGAKFMEHGVQSAALAAFQNQLLEPMNSLVLRNRGSGPIGILGDIDERCGGVFDNIDDVIPQAEIEAYMARYKAAAGFARDELNAAPSTIPHTLQS